jgi:hypothetical protein
VLSACSSGGGSSSSTPTPTPNTAPVANAGPNQTVAAGAQVTLNGSASSDADGSISGYAWSQTAGTAVTLSNSSAAQPTFTAPSPAGATTLTFSLVVTDNRGQASTASTVNILVNPAGGAGSVAGRITFVRIPFGASLSAGLDYSKPQNRPARGVTVRALAAGTATELARTVTDTDGDYSMVVSAGANVTVEVVAEMVKAGALPNWNFTVRDLPATMTTTPNPLPATYTYSDGVQFAAGGAAHDIPIPSGFNADGDVTGTRASAPFAILDTFYQGVQLLLGVEPNIDFPDLVADWGVNNTPVDGTFFSSGPLQHMVLTAAVTADTDEFDQHVIAHEFGHYIEYNFSRADNIGGQHGVGDKLDPRVAFGEGFGYAFGAIVLNDPVSRDSFVDDTSSCPNSQCSSTFDVNDNPPAPFDAAGCWCSESSVWSVLWDVFDNDGETGDTVTLGFKPMWSVLVGPQKNAPAFTTVFSFISALKAANSGSAPGIDALLAAQNITGTGIDAFGSTESHAPTPNIPSLAALPVYAVPSVGGGPIVLRTVNDGAGLQENVWNKLGTHRFIRFTSPGGNITITANSTNASANKNVDFVVYRASPFGVVRRGEAGPEPGGETETFNTAAADYLIDVYDCANGCDVQPQGTSGDYDLTVTIN